MPKEKVSYRVYQHTRVKHKIPFFGEDVYPVYITVTYGHRALNFKSRLFETMAHYSGNNPLIPAPSVENIMKQEAQLVSFIVESLNANFSADLFKRQYAFYTTNLLQELEEQVKEFLIAFFTREGMPSMAHLINSTSGDLSADIIISELEKSLSPALVQNLMNDQFFKQVPYRPLKRFYESVSINDMPVLTAFNFSRKPFNEALSFFLINEFPQYAGYDFKTWLDNFIGSKKEKVMKKSA